MNRLILIASAATTAVPAHAKTYLDNARAADVDPQSESIRVLREDCDNGRIRELRRSGGREYGGTFVGGVAGALIGSQVGGSRQCTTRMCQNPGTILPVRVFVEPVGPYCIAPRTSDSDPRSP